MADTALSQEFEGEVWCVTGTFKRFKPRELAMEEVKRRGGKVTSSVTGNTTHLLAGENPGSKLEKARQLGTTIVSEEAFIDRLEG
jgi:DNA ligase (NAD+)